MTYKIATEDEYRKALMASLSEFKIESAGVIRNGEVTRFDLVKHDAVPTVICANSLIKG